jgi:hypothetical protein
MNGADMSRLYDPNWNSAIVKFHDAQNPIGGCPDVLGFLHPDPNLYV